MPPEALHTAITTPIISAVPALAADRLVADWTAWLNTVDAPGGKAWSRPLTSWCSLLFPMWIRLATPSSAIRAGNRARNQW
jgi:hypothetical protein